MGKTWQNWLILALGLWLFVSPALLAFAFDTGRGIADFTVTGVALMALGAFAASARTVWTAWLTLLLGLWLIASPWLVGFASRPRPLGDAVIVGAAVVILSAWMILRDTPRPGAAGTER